MRGIAHLFIVMGIIFIGAGAVMLLTSYFSLPIGKLPGDIVIRKKNFVFFAPITSMVLLSVVLTVILRIISRFFH